MWTGDNDGIDREAFGRFSRHGRRIDSNAVHGTEADQRAGLASRLQFVRYDIGNPLPVPDETFDAVYAESVIALLEPEPVLRKVARMLRPGGKLALNERIWRPGVSQEQVDLTNEGSGEAFGILATTPTPLDRDEWIAMLDHAALRVDHVIPVAGLRRPDDGPSVLSSRIERYRHYILRPGLAWHQVQFKLALRKRRQSFDVLESYLFFAHKPRWLTGRPNRNCNEARSASTGVDRYNFH